MGLDINKVEYSNKTATINQKKRILMCLNKIIVPAIKPNIIIITSNTFQKYDIVVEAIREYVGAGGQVVWEEA